MAALNQQVLEEIEPTIRALRTHGFDLVATEGGGMMFWADFPSTEASLRIVKDRGFWHMAGDIDSERPSPSRKSQSAVIRDALDWISNRNA